MFDSIDDVVVRLGEAGYFVDREFATTVYLSGRLGKPMLLEGEARVGKTEVAAALARALGTRLVRLQCHEALDRANALYEWNHARQLLRIRLAEAGREPAERAEREIFSEEYLVKHPLLAALTDDAPDPPVLLIDEIDRAGEEFETLLVELLCDSRVVIPEMGVMKVEWPRFVVLTGNGAREVHEALRRRCLYFWVGYPSFEREYGILMAKVPGISRVLAGQLCNVMARLRQEPFRKRPGISETIDWGMALVALRRDALDPDMAEQTIGCVFKHADDIRQFRKHRLAELLSPAVDRMG